MLLPGVLLFLLLAMVLPASAEGECASDISAECTVSITPWAKTRKLFDGDTEQAIYLPEKTQITLEHPDGIGSLYLIFNIEYGAYTVTDLDSGTQGTFGTNCFLHEFADLEGFFGKAPTAITVSFDSGDLLLNEISVFSPGEVPAYVQKWEWPEDERADLILFSTHCDDEQLFFGGVLPYYAGQLDYRVQVVYLTNHRNLDTVRAHEGLDGLWNVGVRRYPVFGTFGDYYCRTREKAYEMFAENGVTERELTAFVVEQLRRFRPLVALGHDVNGEYGHGQHMAYADALIAASEVSAHPGSFPESAETYGLWDVPKVYLHLYELNQIWVDWDRPLDRFDGMTAYQVTKEIGYPSHKSQVEGFAWYMTDYDRAADIEYYNPCIYGLYRSTVGPDVNRNDFFEHLHNYEEQDLLGVEAADLEIAEPSEEVEPVLQTEPAPTEPEVQQQPDGVPVPVIFVMFFLLAAAGACFVILWHQKNIPQK